MKQALKIVIYVPTFNAGDTTRGIEVAKALSAEAVRKGRAVDFTFVCPPIAGFNFESLIVESGFKIGHTAVPLDQKHIDDFMTADRTGTEFVPDFERAKLYVAKYIEDLRARKPDLVIYGCMPPAGVAARILNLPTVTYLPFPAHKNWIKANLLKDLPDEMENRFTLALPKSLRKGLVGTISRLAVRKSFFTQPTLARAGKELGWLEDEPNLFTMLKGDVELVTDWSGFYEDQETGPRAQITGPLFSRPPDKVIDPRILAMFSPEKRNKVFVTMGSSGEKRFLMEAIRAVCRSDFHAVVVVQKTICALSEVTSQIQVPANVYLTDSFVPAHQVNPLADAVIIHGGQGTVQTACSSGTPFVGVAMQAEQQANLDNLASHGAGLRIARGFWQASRITAALDKVLNDPSYRLKARRLAGDFTKVDGHARAGRAIWDLVETRNL